MKSSLRKWLTHVVIAVVVVTGLYLVLANLFLNTEIASQLINRKPEKLWIRWEKGWTLFPGIVHVQGLQIRGQDRRFQWYAELDEIRASIDLIPLLLKRFQANSMNGRGLEFRMRQRLRPDEPKPQYVDLTPSIPGLSNPPQPPPENLYPRTTRKSPWTLEMNNIAISDVRTLWIEQFRFAGDGRVSGSMIHTIRGPLEVPRATVVLTSGNWWIGDTVVEEDSELHADITIDEFVPSEEKGIKALGFVSGTVRHTAAVKGLNFLKAYFRKMPWLNIDGSGVLDAELHLEKGVLSQETRVTVETAEIVINAANYTITTKGPGKVQGRVELENGKPVAKVSVALETFELAQAQAQRPFALGRELQVSGTSSDLDLRDPFTDLTLIVDLPDAEVPELSFFNTLIPQEMDITIRAGSGRMRSRFTSSPQERTAEGKIEVVGQGTVMQYRHFTIGGDLSVKADLEYGLEEDEDGLIVFSDAPFEVSKLSVALTSGKIRDRQQVIAQDFTLELESAFDQYTLDPHKALSVFDYTSGSLRVAGRIPNLPYFNDYLPSQTGLRIRSGTGQIQTRFETASGQPDATGHLVLIGEDVTAELKDLVVAGELELSADLQYGLQERDDKGLVAFSELGWLEVLKASVTLTSGKIRDRQQTIAKDFTLELQSEFAQYTLDLKKVFDLTRFMSASARVDGTIPDLSYLNNYIPSRTGLRIRSGAGRFDGLFETAQGHPTTTANLAITGTGVAAAFQDVALSGNLKVVTDVQYGPSDKGERADGLIVLTEGPLAIRKASLQLASGEVRLRDGKAVKDLTINVDSIFDHLVLAEQKSQDALRSISGTVRVAGRVPGLQFLNAYFRKAPWLDINGSGTLNAFLRVRKGRLVAGSRLAVDSDEIRATYLDFKARGSGKVRGRVAREKDRAFAEVTVTLDDFELGRSEYVEPHIFGIGFEITGTSSELDLTDPFTDLKVVLDLPESDVPNFGFYNAYVPPDSCFFIHSGRGRIRTRIEASETEASAKGEVEFRAERIVAQFRNVTMAGDMTLHAHLKNGDLKARTFDIGDTKLELNNMYVGTAKIGTDTTWWARLSLPQAKMQVTTPAQLEARIEMEMRDSRPVVVLLSEKKGIVRWFKNLLTVTDIKTRADFKMDGKAVEVEDLEMTGDRLKILGELDIFQRQVAGVFYAKLRALSVAVELRDGKKKWRISKARPWFDKRRQIYRTHKRFEQDEGLVREPPAQTDPGKGKANAPGECWQ
ncbi:MAG: hypothetical protein ACE5NW_02635 [Acidiferrobacterales bacterium]